MIFTPTKIMVVRKPPYKKWWQRTSRVNLPVPWIHWLGLPSCRVASSGTTHGANVTSGADLVASGIYRWIKSTARCCDPLLGCPSKLGSRVSKWVITPLYPIYKYVITHLIAIDPNFLTHPSTAPNNTLLEGV